MSAENYSEKVSVNMNAAVLSEIDLLVDGGYYSNRSDFINQAVREALQRQQSTIERIVISKNVNFGVRMENNSKNWFLGISGLTKKELQQMDEEGQQIDMSGYGLLIIDEDCPEEQLFRVVKSISVRGKVRCAPAVREHYGL
ncbi:MAG: hypothetical protein E7449_03075 [Ruminococcaceae bacterium]|nr:hypothetical protein [Oscillospiraceae bacterium]